MKKLFFIGLISTMVFVMPCRTFSQTTEKTAKKITYTTLDVKKDYEVIHIVTGYSEITATLTFLKAYAAAWANLTTEATILNADAVVGIRVEFANTDASGSKLLVYGTAIKYK